MENQNQGTQEEQQQTKQQITPFISFLQKYKWILIVLAFLLLFLSVSYIAGITLKIIPPLGCHYQKVVCIQAPCDPLLVCEDQTVSQLNPSTSPSSFLSPNPTPTSSDPTANWKTFTNGQRNIMFKYPPIWKVEETHGGGGNPDSEFSFFPLNVTPDITVGDHRGNAEILIIIQPQASPHKNKNDQLLQNKYPVSRIDAGKAGGTTTVYNEIGTMSIYFIFTEEAQSYLYKILSTFKFLSPASSIE